MKKLLPLLVFVSFLSTAQNSPRLWYQNPAKIWNEALPIGNGRLGAMVFGGIGEERIQLNEESLWGGMPENNLNPKSLDNLAEIQKLVFDEKFKEAYSLSTKSLLATPPRFRSYQTLGDLYFETPLNGPVSNYSRALYIDKGMVVIRYTSEGVSYTREIVASAEHDCLIMRISSDTPGTITGKFSLVRTKDATTTAWGEDGLLMNGQIVNIPTLDKGKGGMGMKFSTALKVRTKGGSTLTSHNGLYVEKADMVTIVLSAFTDYDFKTLGFDRSKNTVSLAQSATTAALPEIKDSSFLWSIGKLNRFLENMVFTLGVDKELEKLPTDKRLQAVRNGGHDSDLFALYFMYGRYLLASSSQRPGVLPANLQGIWNEHYNAPWESDYHTNINLQMNYWPANVTNLDPTNEALFNFIDNYRSPGRDAAKKMYGANGWTMHHATDVFGKTGVNAGIHWGMSPLAGAWLTTHLWEHYLFTEDLAFLRDKAYPIIKEAIQFIESFLVEAPDGTLAVNPSISPENTFLTSANVKSQLTYNPSIDIQTIREIYKGAIKAAEILKVDKGWVAQLQKTLLKIPEIAISERYGIIQEWVKDYEEAEPGHRHISQLVGLYPFNQITHQTPELFKAADATLTRRLSHGGGHTGWSRAWITALYARLQNKEKTYENIHALLAKSTLNNLFDSHPPFQIDGNFGGTAAIAEMLLQSHTDEIHILPTVPSEWPNGRIKGIKARGNIEFEIIWINGKLNFLQAKATSDKKVKVRYQDKLVEIPLVKGQWVQINDFTDN